MNRRNIFAIVAGIATFNGVFSPWVAYAALLSPIWYPPWLVEDIRILFMLSSLIVATTTLMLAGVPAALAERAFPNLRGSDGDLWIWAGAAGLLSLPGLERLAQTFGA
jgi:hypothetical protein